MSLESRILNKKLYFQKKKGGKTALKNEINISLASILL